MAAVNCNINLPKIMKYGSLFCGIAIMFAGLSVTLNVLNAFHVPTFVLAISQVLFGLLIAQTVRPMSWASKWFPFVQPYHGRGAFMVYVGFSLFYDPFGFIEIIGICTVILGLIFLAVGCGTCGDVRAEGEDSNVAVPKGAKPATQV